MPQIGYPLNKAHEALDAFLAEPDGHRYERWFSTVADDDLDKGDVLAYIVPAASMHELRKGHDNWMNSEEFRTENEEHPLPPGYHPWHHSPLATTDRMLPVEPLLPVLAHAMYRKKYEELEQGDQDQVRYVAICCLLNVRLDPDGQGAVPILSVGHETDEPGGALRWKVGFVTDVPGLYLRVTANGFFGEEWGIVTGSGYRLHGGWHSKDGAATCAAALGRVLPNVDWMRLVPDNFTPAAKDAIRAVVKRYGPWSAEDSKDPEPEPVDIAIPEPAAS